MSHSVTIGEIMKKLNFIAEQSRLVIVDFEMGSYAEAVTKLINLRAAATIAKQEIESLAAKQKDYS